MNRSTKYKNSKILGGHYHYLHKYWGDMSPCPIGIDAHAYRRPTVYFYTVVSGEINYVLIYLLYMCIRLRALRKIRKVPALLALRALCALRQAGNRP